MAFYRAGRLMTWFAVAMLAICVVGAIVLESLVIDFAVVIVYFLGKSVANGNRRAAKWSA
jgi:hypothetical protein